jgi:V/A-type H+-transporting ATPase subunit G/H
MVKASLDRIREEEKASQDKIAMAQKKASEIVASARKEAQSILESAKRDAQRQSAQLIERAEAEALREADDLRQDNEVDIRAIKDLASKNMKKAVLFIREGIVKAHGSR